MFLCEYSMGIPVFHRKFIFFFPLKTFLRHPVSTCLTWNPWDLWCNFPYFLHPKTLQTEKKTALLIISQFVVKNTSRCRWNIQRFWECHMVPVAWQSKVGWPGCLFGFLIREIFYPYKITKVGSIYLCVELIWYVLWKWSELVLWAENWFRCLPLSFILFLGIHGLGGYWWILVSFCFERPRAATRIVMQLEIRMKNSIIVLGRRHIDVTPRR